MKKKRVVLVLGSGGARGLAHIGVLKSLQKFKIPIDAVIGTSMGAFVGAFYCKGYSIDEMEKIALSVDKLFTLKMLLPSFPKFGLVDPSKIKEYLSKFLNDTKIEELQIPFFAVTTDLISGNEVIINSGSLVDAVISSVAVPGLIKPHYYRKRYFVDGGLVNPLPVSVAYKLNPSFVIAVNVSKSPIKIKKQQKKFFEKSELFHRIKKSEFITKIGDIIPEKIISTFFDDEKKDLPEYPGMVQSLLQSFSIMENQLIKIHLQFYPPNVLINPQVQDFNMLEFHRSKELIDIGEKTALTKITEIKRELKRLGIG